MPVDLSGILNAPYWIPYTFCIFLILFRIMCSSMTVLLQFTILLYGFLCLFDRFSSCLPSYMRDSMFLCPFYLIIWIEKIFTSFVFYFKTALYMSFIFLVPIMIIFMIFCSLLYWNWCSLLYFILSLLKIMIYTAFYQLYPENNSSYIFHSLLY